MSVHSFGSTAFVSPEEFIFTHFTSKGWTPGPHEVEHYKNTVKETYQRSNITFYRMCCKRGESLMIESRINWRQVTCPTCTVYHSAGHGWFPQASSLAGLGFLHLLSSTSNSTPCESITQKTSRVFIPCSPSLQLFVQSVHIPISHLNGKWNNFTVECL